jgi:hypothetical protein
MQVVVGRDLQLSYLLNKIMQRMLYRHITEVYVQIIIISQVFSCLILLPWISDWNSSG